MKKFIAVVLIVIMVLTMASCNYQFFDTKYNFTHAILKKIRGVTYLVHSTNIVLSDK